MQYRIFRQILLSALFLALFSTSAYASFAISLDYGISTYSTADKTIINDAKNYWEGVINGYQPGITLSGFTINVSTYTDGLGGSLGSGGPTFGIVQNGYTLTTLGVMEFDTVDLATLSESTKYDLMRHEIGHVIGFGTLWTYNGVYVEDSGQYTGANALAAWRNEFVGHSTDAFVPVELGGGGGTANGHWNEVDGGSSATNIVDSLGRDMSDELMTGWIDINSPRFVSQTTLASFEDIGYQLVPEPGTLTLLGFGLASLFGFRRRKRR